MTLGLLWSVVAVGGAVFISPYLLKPANGLPRDAGDRYVAAATVAAATALLVAGALSGPAAVDLSTPVAVDAAFWAGIGTASAVYAGRARSRPFRSPAMMAAEMAPWLLTAYGTYSMGCVIRDACAALLGGSAVVAAEAVAGGALLVAAWLVHRMWPLGPSAIVAMSVALVAGARLLTNTPAQLPITAAALVAVVVVAATSGLRVMRRKSTDLYKATDM